MKCKFIKPDGQKCNANALTENDFCFSHDPSSSQRKQEASLMGGLAVKKVRNDLPIVQLETPADVVNLLALTINEVREGKADLKTANCIGFLSGHLIKAIEVSRLSERIEIIEKIILE